MKMVWFDIKILLYSQAVVEIQNVADYVRHAKLSREQFFNLTVMVTLLDSGLRSSTSGGLKRQTGSNSRLSTLRSSRQSVQSYWARIRYSSHI